MPATGGLSRGEPALQREACARVGVLFSHLLSPPSPLRGTANLMQRITALLVVACVFFCGAVAFADSDTTGIAREIVAARSEWRERSSVIRGLVEKLKDLARSLTELEDRSAKVAAEISKLVAEKETTLAELRQGMFCSGCGRTRADILAKGERFPHEGRTSTPATPEQIKAAEDGFDRRIAPLKKEGTKLAADEAAQRAEIFDLVFKFNSAWPVYHGWIAREQKLRMAEWEIEKSALEKQLEALRSAHTAAEQALRVAAGKQAEDLRRLEPLRRSTQAKWAEAMARMQDSRTAAERRLKVMDEAVLAADQAVKAAEEKKDTDLSRLVTNLRMARATLAAARSEVEAGRADDERKAKELREAADAAEQALKKAQAGDAVSPLETNLRILQSQWIDSLGRAHAAQKRAERQAEDFVQAALWNLDETSKPAESVPLKYGIPGGFVMRPLIRNPNPPVACTITALRRFDGVASGAELRDRLEAGLAESPGAPPAAAKKSMKDFMEGK